MPISLKRLHNGLRWQPCRSQMHTTNYTRCGLLSYASRQIHTRHCWSFIFTTFGCHRISDT